MAVELPPGETGFQSAPERGLRGIVVGYRRRAGEACFNPPRSAGSGESSVFLGCGSGDRGFNPPRSAGSGESIGNAIGGYPHAVSIRPGARAPGNLNR